MAESSFPVDLLNPGQVFACLGVLEAAEILLGPAEGAFTVAPGQVSSRFVCRVEGPSEPLKAVLDFLMEAELRSVVPDGAAPAPDVPSIAAAPSVWPSRVTLDLATRPLVLVRGSDTINISHFAEGSEDVRPSVKFWAGKMNAFGCFESLLRGARETLRRESAFTDPMNEACALDKADPRLDVRRGRPALDEGFSVDKVSGLRVFVFPLTQILAAVGLEFARPREHDQRLHYAVSGRSVPTPLFRALVSAPPSVLADRLFSFCRKMEDKYSYMDDVREERI